MDKSSEGGTCSASRTENVIDVESLIDSKGHRTFQFTVITICGLVMFLDGLNTQIIGYIGPLIAKEWHVPPGGLAPVFSAGLVGLMVGYLICPIFSEKLGQKRVLIACTLAFALFTFLTVTATNLTQMECLRFLTGLGLGGATPCAVALTSEYSPKRIRATSVLLIYCGFSLGFVVAGVVAAKLLPHYGWHTLLWVCGGVPLALTVALIFVLPESLAHMLAKGYSRAPIVTIIRRLAPDLDVDDRTGIQFAGLPAKRVPLFVIFERRRAAGTFLIWIAFFMNLGVFYALQSWLPSVLTRAGYGIGDVALVTALTTTGGIIAAFVAGPLMDRGNPYLAVGCLFLGGCVLLAVLGLGLTWSLPWLAVVAFSVGFCVSGGQKSGIALAALYYPISMRSTGVGWALGMSRLGGIFGPLLFGWLLAREWSPASAFLMGSVPMLIAGVAILVMGRIYRPSRDEKGSTQPAAPDSTAALAPGD